MPTIVNSEPLAPPSPGIVLDFINDEYYVLGGRISRDDAIKLVGQLAWAGVLACPKDDAGRYIPVSINAIPCRVMSGRLGATGTTCSLVLSERPNPEP